MVAPEPGELPHLKSIARFGDDLAERCIFDIKFYPYAPAGTDPVFAVTGGRHTVICRPLPERDKGIEVLRSFEDDDEEDPSLNSLAWAHAEQDASGDPLVCVSGGNYLIKVLNVITGTAVRTLAGHGGPVTDLIASPTHPHLLASASEDHTIRLWDLRPEFEKDPCRVICAGEGHKSGVLTIAFHRSGQYLLSGGFDSRINLWILPSPKALNPGIDKTKVIHFPHFSTVEVHSDYIDCVSFHGDLILSKSAKANRILLWSITGFNSRTAHNYTQAQAPTSHGHAETRSAFHRNPNSSTNTASKGSSICDAANNMFQILLTFACPGTDPFWMRFSVFHCCEPAQGEEDSDYKHPILAMGHHIVLLRDSKSRLASRGHVSFWDLRLLQDGLVGDATTGKANGNGNGGGKGKGRLHRGKGLGRHVSVAAASSAGGEVEEGSERGSSVGRLTPLSNGNTTGNGNGNGNGSETKEGTPATGTNKLKGPFHALPPHKVVEDPTANANGTVFTPRGIAWSTGGEWCVVAGDACTMWVMRRWGGVRW